MKALKLISIYLATIGTILLIVILTIGAELLPALKANLKNTFGHHWIGKSILATIMFFITFFAFRKVEFWDIKRWTILLAAIWILGNLIIFGFFIWHFLASG